MRFNIKFNHSGLFMITISDVAYNLFDYLFQENENSPYYCITPCSHELQTTFTLINIFLTTPCITI